MFTIPVGDILASYTGDSKEFSFSGEIFDGYYDDIIFLDPLVFDIHIIALDDGVQVVFDDFRTRVKYDGESHVIRIPHFERMWKLRIDRVLDGDDVKEIDSRSMTIDLSPVIREEIVMACHEL